MYVTLSASVDNLCMLSKFSVVTVCVSLKDTHRAVVLAKLLYASPAWWGFASTADKQRIEALVRRGIRLGLYGDGDPTATELVEDADESLFKSIMYNQHHVLQ